MLDAVALAAAGELNGIMYVVSGSDSTGLTATVQAYDPAANIEAGIKHLKSLLARFPRALALAAYNAGDAAVERFGGIPPYAETRNYVSRILQIVGRS